MFSSIPRRILQETLVVGIPEEFDRWQWPLIENTEEHPDVVIVKHVHFQYVNETRQTATNDEVQLKGIVFVDAKYSTPQLDYEDLQRMVQEAGGVMQCIIVTRRGTEIGPMNIVAVDACPDDEANVHHWELGVM